MQTPLLPDADTLIERAIAEDLGERGDITSLATLKPGTRVRGRIIAKAPGVIAGLQLVIGVYARIDPDLSYRQFVQDGDAVVRGQDICEVEGEARSVLAGERTALNFLQRLSGIASMTAQFVNAVAETETFILDTRKTTPGWRTLEKYAVKMGGGQNHRIGLYDAVLIKDNHIDAAGGVTAAISAVRSSELAVGLPVICEVRDFQELAEALQEGVDRILLDNMSEDEMRQAVEMVGGRIPLEASGNMTLARVKAVAETGVNYISVGALTHSAPALDLSMRLVDV